MCENFENIKCSDGNSFVVSKHYFTGCPKKHVTLFVKAIIFRPRIARSWYYTHFEADPLRLEMSTHTSHRCVKNLSYSQISLEISKQK